MPRKIALLIHSLSGGGAERLMSQLAERWSPAHDLHLVTWSTSETDRYPIPASVQRHSLDLQRPSVNRLAAVLANIRRVQRLRKQLQSIAPDFVLSFCDQMNIVALEAVRPLGIPTWIAEHSDPAKQQLGRMWELWRARSYPTCSGAIALTQRIAQTMQQWIPAEKLRVIPPAIHPPQRTQPCTRSKYAVTSNETKLQLEPTKQPSDAAAVLTFIYLGRLSREKGVDVLLNAWHQVVSRCANSRLIIIGDGAQRAELEQQASELANVEFRGWSEHPWQELGEADCFVLPSRYEGFPVALLEAMDSGLACIATDCTSALDELNQAPASFDGHATTEGAALARALSPSPTGPPLLRVPTEDPSRLADAMLNLAADAKLRHDLGLAAQNVATRYHWPRIGLMWDALLST